MKIRELMKVPVTSIRPDETVAAAIQKLIEYDRGSISVCNEKGELVGIISERDIVRKCFARNCDVANTRIEDVMSTGVAIGTPEDALEYAVSVMKQKKIRHLPIVENNKVVGIVSMRDLLDVQLSETKAEIRYVGLMPRHRRRPVV